MRQYRWGILILLSTLLLVVGCGGKQLTPLEHGKVVGHLASETWATAQETFARAYLDATITEHDWERFRALDAKVIRSGRILRDALRAWEAGTDPSPDRINALTAHLLSIFTEVAQLALELQLAMPKNLTDVTTPTGGTR